MIVADGVALTHHSGENSDVMKRTLLSILDIASVYHTDVVISGTK